MHFDKHLLIFSVIVICASAAHFLDQEWNAWKTKYGKKYPNYNRESFRRKAWEATWEKVQKHNKLADQGLKSYRMEMNHFADMTTEEWKSKSCFKNNRKSTISNIATDSYVRNTNIPEEVDWRKSNCVTPAKNQGGFCGSCWAFSAVGVLESHYCIQNNELPLLSEQQLVDCDPKNQGCCGGFPVDALAYVTQHGIMRSKDYEYVEKKYVCSFNEDKAIRLNVTKYYTLPGEDNMAASVAFNGPITIGIAASDDFMLYKEGIFDGECAEEANHAIIIVGYGTEKSKDDEEEQEYWIIKNSWGKEWGEEGFAKVKRNVNMCNIAEVAASLDFSFD
ncbi:uncharacterized protein LOC128492265 [Spea bombifrons]|uniref:uncharacterized protein LOC128492265 n=1 Tax=Spea bombifrons TaxID=233779 RepID=UPI00234938DB|nr:uncharacterized protein LOC128492265 [Spea bombifrons]